MTKINIILRYQTFGPFIAKCFQNQFMSMKDISPFILSGKDQLASSPSGRRMDQKNLGLQCPSPSSTIHYISSAACYRGFLSAIGNAQTYSPTIRVASLWLQSLVSLKLGLCRDLHILTVISTRDVPIQSVPKPDFLIISII